jgi:murein DD-endopeptidase MepM/ murein hydrolase activator NlpD
MADGVSHLAFASIPLGIQPGIYTMTITATEQTGTVTPLTFNVQVNSGFYGTQSVTLPASKQELLVPGVENNERSILESVTTGFTSERYFDGPMGLPAAASMFSAFGARRIYNGQPIERYHTGADFAGVPGTPVLAAAPGRVVLADTMNIRGVAVILDHGWGVYTSYAHMNDRYVSIGEFVQAGQALGTIGSTGRATGAHLHWEVWVNGRPVDPMQWAIEAFP